MRINFEVSYFNQAPTSSDRRLGALDKLANLEPSGKRAYDSADAREETSNWDVAVAGCVPVVLADVVQPDPLVTAGPADSRDGVEPLKPGGSHSKFNQILNRAADVRVEDATVIDGAHSSRLAREVLKTMKLLQIQHAAITYVEKKRSDGGVRPPDGPPAAKDLPAIPSRNLTHRGRTSDMVRQG